MSDVKVGYIGLGNQGLPMAKRLAARYAKTIGWSATHHCRIVGWSKQAESDPACCGPDETP